MLCSELEKTLFHGLGFDDKILDSLDASNRMAVEDAFIENLQGKNIDALRKAAKAVLIDGRPYRLTKEFDKLLEW